MLYRGRDWRLEVLASNDVKCGVCTPRYRKNFGKEGQFSAYRSPETEGMPRHGGGSHNNASARVKNQGDRDGEKTVNTVASRCIMGSMDLES